MENIRGKLFVLNGKVAEPKAYRPGDAPSIYYEVIRLIKGRLIFLDDHLERLESSCNKAHHAYPGSDVLTRHLKLLLSLDLFQEGNVKITVFKLDQEIQTACFFIPYNYPSEEDYIRGVASKTYQFRRPDPNIKCWNENFRNDVNRFIKEENIYEAILINEKGLLSEGSRSNLFFIDSKKRIYTAPLKEILPGITRKYVLQICSELGYEVIEKMPGLEDAKNMKSCFLTGTSPKILPVKIIDDLPFETNSALIREIMRRYQAMIDEQVI